MKKRAVAEATTQNHQTLYSRYSVTRRTLGMAEHLASRLHVEISEVEQVIDFVIASTIFVAICFGVMFGLSALHLVGVY